jgi:N-acetylneuraminic acid mutarotase
MKTFAPLLSLLAAIAPAAAAADLEFSNGIVGQNVTLDLSGDPGEIYFLLLSTNTGPTPLAIVDPADPRFVSVGVDLLPFTTTGLVPTSFVVPLPNDPVLVGGVLYGQFVTVPGSLYLVDDISNPVAIVLTAIGATLPTLGNLAQARSLATATPLLDGDVLVAGGGTGGITGAMGLSSAEIYRRHLRVFETVPGGMAGARAFHTATRLLDGRVLVAGGVDGAGSPTSSAEIYDPATNSFAPTGSMGSARTGHTTSLLPNGKVYVTGGVTILDGSNLLATIASTQNSTEIWDPATGLWSAGPNMSSRRVGHVAESLADGKVLLHGGVTVTFLFGLPIPSFSSTAQRYDPGSNTYVATSSASVVRAFHRANRLGDGRVLVLGGVNGDLVTQTFIPLASCEVYDPVTNVWIPAASMANARSLHTSQLLPDGRVVAVGGAQGSLAAPTPIASIEVYTPVPSPGLGSWAASGTLGTPRASHTSALTKDGKHVVVMSGTDGMASVPTAVVHTP